MMNQGKATQPSAPEHHDDGLHAPPRLLLGSVIGLFALLVIAGLAGVVYFSSGQRLSSLVPFVVGLVALIVVGGFAAGIIFRKRISARFLMWLLIGLFLLAIIASVSGVFVYRNLLPPRYQEQMLTEVPALRFMQAFLPGTPEGGILPTVNAVVNPVSPADLMSLSFDTATPTGGAPVSVTQPLPSATPDLPSATPTTEQSATPMPTATPVPPTLPPTAVAIAPTQDTTLVTAANTLPNRDRSHRMYGFTHILQGWNDCGPANITQALSYYGWTQDQSVAAAYLKPDAEDKNVSPAEMVAFVNTQTQVRAVTRIGGSLELLKDFISHDIPILIETSYMPEGNDWLGHYQTIVGYDDATQNFAIYDTWINSGPAGGDLVESYANLDSLWQAFNRGFIVVYRPDDEALVQSILGDLADLTTDAEHAYDVARQEAQANPQNAFAWFNMGTALTHLQEYANAATAFDRARQVGLPWRMLWYQFGPYEAYFNVGRYDDVIGLANVTLTNTTNIEESYYWQGRVYQQEGNIQAAHDSYSLALQHNSHFATAQQAIASLNS